MQHPTRPPLPTSPTSPACPAEFARRADARSARPARPALLLTLVLGLLLALLTAGAPARAQGVQTHQFTGWPMRLNPASLETGQAGLSDPYPSSVLVLDIPEDHVVVSFEVVLNGLTHPRLHDLDFLLVAPNGRSSLLLSDVAGWNVADRRITIRDDAPSLSELPDGNAPVTLGPSNVDGGGDWFPAPAPAAGWGLGLAPLTAGSVNGWWQMFATNERFFGHGVLRNWSLVFQTQSVFVETPLPPMPGPTPPIPEPGTWVMLALGLAVLAWRRRAAGAGRFPAR